MNREAAKFAKKKPNSHAYKTSRPSRLRGDFSPLSIRGPKVAVIRPRHPRERGDPSSAHDCAMKFAYPANPVPAITPYRHPRERGDPSSFPDSKNMNREAAKFAKKKPNSHAYKTSRPSRLRGNTSPLSIRRGNSGTDYD
jgi:hypothetical protein